MRFPFDIDEFRSWLAETYCVGEQRHLEGSARTVAETDLRKESKKTLTRPRAQKSVRSQSPSTPVPTSARDGTGRLFIVERGGMIKVLQPGSTLPTVFLDLTSKVVAGGERGLLGLAFHPNYAANGLFFVNYTRAGDGATVVAEYSVSGNPNVANTIETVLLTIAQPFANHNGGMIEFGPDNYFYIGMGDGGSGNDPGNRAQNINDLLGKMLRIDVDSPSFHHDEHLFLWRG